MKLTKRGIVLLGLLGLAAVAIVVDRLVQSAPAAAPQPAAASSPVSGAAHPAPARPATPTATGTPAATAVQASAIADRLRRAGEGLDMDPMNLRDAFVPPESWLARPPTPEGHAAAPAAPVADSADRFVREHKLTSVLIDADGGIAVVNDKVLRVGQEIDGYRLVRLAPGTALFTGGDGGASVRLRTVPPSP